MTLDSSETLLHSKEKNEKREREPDLAPQTINAENRYAYKCAHFIKLSLRDVFEGSEFDTEKIIDHNL